MLYERTRELAVNLLQLYGKLSKNVRESSITDMLRKEESGIIKCSIRTTKCRKRVEDKTVTIW